ncbi:hypothetical protein GCM10009544_34370 [Streptomyces stramineus]|uniref:Secreted protein n=1 Tax=Streptomyces stramineus TaxID=173861 RepID=A0ABN1A787_9ACTN
MGMDMTLRSLCSAVTSAAVVAETVGQARWLTPAVSKEGMAVPSSWLCEVFALVGSVVRKRRVVLRLPASGPSR